jgi:hypothetical protein
VYAEKKEARVPSIAICIEKTQAGAVPDLGRGVSLKGVVPQWIGSPKPVVTRLMPSIDVGTIDLIQTTALQW